jgi:hypothetical protein
LFIASPTSNTSSHYSWIDNTPSVWDSVISVLEEQDPKRIAINVDKDVAFSAGLHAGELEEFDANLGIWKERFVREKMVGVEVVAWMRGGGDEKSKWYKGLMSTAWACIGDAFSERVIKPGETTTGVCALQPSDFADIRLTEKQNRM